MSDEPNDTAAVAHLRRARVLVFLVLSLIVLAIAWRWSSLASYLDAGVLRAHLEGSTRAPTPFVAIGIVTLACILAIPLSIIVALGALIYGATMGPILVLSGAELGAAISFALGKHLGHDALRMFAGQRLRQLSERLGDRGFLSVVAIRLIPAAPFAIMNMLAGASHIRTRDFLLGTIVGMLPGTLAITLFVDQIVYAIRVPGWQSLMLLAAILIAIVGGGVLLRRWLGISGKSAVEKQ